MENKFWKEFSKVIVIILFTIPVGILRGYVFTQFWNWFIIPIFSFRVLNVPEAIGLSMFLSLLILKRQVKRTEKDTYWLEGVVETSVLLLLIWFFGWILKIFL